MVERADFDFGTGSFVSQIMADPDFFKKVSIQDQAKFIGYANGCPVTDELTDPNNETPGRGPEPMRDRYGEVNNWYTYIERAAKDKNPHLYSQLSTSVPRRLMPQGLLGKSPDSEVIHEPAGRHEPQSVPEFYYNEMSPMNTLPGFALPRIFVEQIGHYDPTEFSQEAQDRLMRGLEILEQAIPEAQTPAELLALVAEGVSQADADPKKVLKHILGVGWLEEQNAQQMRQAVCEALAHKAPNLSALFMSLSPEERAEAGL